MRKNVFILLSVVVLISCGAEKKKTVSKNQNPVDTNTTQQPVEDKSYLKKRPEEFKEFLFLTDVVPFTGKVATQKDVKSGAAVFNMDVKNDTSHHVLNINLPFYAFLPKPNAKPIFVVVMQAEKLRGDTLLGYKAANGLFGFCRPRELEYFESTRGKVFLPKK